MSAAGGDLEARATHWVGARFMKGLTSGRRGRAWLMRFLAAAEVDESDVFDHLLARIDDPELAKLVRIHRDDERRHHEMLTGCLERYKDISVPIVRPEHRMAFHIDRILDGFAEAFVGGRVSVMEAYALLLVLEELTVRSYPMIIDALAPHDPQSAEVLGRVLRDEERHVKYATAISKRYAPDAATLAEALTRFRAAEKRAFADCNRAMTAYIVEHDLLTVGTWEKLSWRAAAAFV